MISLRLQETQRAAKPISTLPQRLRGTRNADQDKYHDRWSPRAYVVFLAQMARRNAYGVWPGGHEGNEVELCDWLWRAIIDEKAILVSSDAYFYLPPMERKLYEVGYAECADRPTATIPLEELRRRMGRHDRLAAFPAQPGQDDRQGITQGLCH